MPHQPSKGQILWRRLLLAISNFLKIIGQRTRQTVFLQYTAPTTYHLVQEMNQTRGETTEQLAMDRLQRFRFIGREAVDFTPPSRLTGAQLNEKRLMCPHMDTETGVSWVKEYYAAGANWKRCQLSPLACGRRWKWMANLPNNGDRWMVFEDDCRIKPAVTADQLANRMRAQASQNSEGYSSALQPASSQAQPTPSSSSSTASTVRNISIATPRTKANPKARASAAMGLNMDRIPVPENPDSDSSSNPVATPREAARAALDRGS